MIAATIPLARLYPLIPLRAWLQHPVESWVLAHGGNPHPVVLVRPPHGPLSAMARLGRAIFHDAGLSSSGKRSCASCHSPAHAYGPPNSDSAMFGGPHLHRQGARAVPSLEYLERQAPFSIGPDNEENENINVQQQIALSRTAAHSRKTARTTAASATNLVPQGGLFWDGRVNTLQQQADGPLFDPAEMDAGTVTGVAVKLRRAPYAKDFTQLFGPGIFKNPRRLVSEAMFAVARYQIEDSSFHPYSSKFDAWLEGKARLSPAEMRGYLLFNDPSKGDCAACHLDKPRPNGLPPLFTDHQYEALGVPRNPAIAANRNPDYFDLGICGPYRHDLKRQTRYCGMFLTPTLRNVATRHAFFHNGIYHSLKQVLQFYDFRDTEPQKIYPRSADGRIDKFNDLPARYRANVDTTDPPFNRRRGGAPPLGPRDIRDILAFLKTLNDGYLSRP
ncbi:MAG TPA: cytochrome c peroxidase [Gammaproteobacteria bacterium]|nr:cytochrome c peroxidase [Gammaproteobacteria bacterium]